MTNEDLTPAEEKKLLKLAASMYGRRGGSVKSPKKAQTPDHYRRIGRLGAIASAKVRAKKHKAKSKAAK